MIEPEIFLGPPGTGKTTTLIRRTNDELKRKIKPNQIGYLSFTRRAAGEAIERACDEFKLARDEFPFFSTLHSLCFKQLGMRSSDVFQGDRVKEFARYAGIKITGRWSDDGTFSGYEKGDRILFMENLARIRCIPLKDQHAEFTDGIHWNEVHRVAKALREFKADNGLMDFTDMLMEFLRSNIRVPIKTLFVDESQDLSQLQWRVVQRLAENVERLVIAGDDDQAIYRWAGADVDHLIDMLGKVRVLNQSYRVPRAVQDLANDIIGRVIRRRSKEWAPRDADGTIDNYRNFEQVNIDDSRSTLILVRNQYFITEIVVPALRRQGILFEKNGYPSVNQKVLSAIVSWERLRKGERVSVPEARNVYTFLEVGQGVKRGFKSIPNVPDEAEVSIQELHDSHGLLRNDVWYHALSRINLKEGAGDIGDADYIRAVLKRGVKLNQRPKVSVSTIHGSKGGQADHVVLLRGMANRTFAEMRTNPDDERRVWYVGATRTKEHLSIVDAEGEHVCPFV